MTEEEWLDLAEDLEDDEDFDPEDYDWEELEEDFVDEDEYFSGEEEEE